MRSLKRRALRHLVAAIQAYLHHKQRCRAADELLARHAQARLLHRWHQRVQAAQGARHLEQLRSLHLAERAFKVAASLLSVLVQGLVRCALHEQRPWQDMCGWSTRPLALCVQTP